MDPLTLIIVLSLFNPYINITSQKFSSTPFHLLFIILYSSPPCGSTLVLPGYLLLQHSCTWDKTSNFLSCHRASFVLEKNAQLLVYKWLKSLCFSDGHASNISALVNIEECRLYRMKSCDCHVFMQTLIPLAYRDLLPKEI
jgi:hypothetical protein